MEETRHMAMEAVISMKRIENHSPKTYADVSTNGISSSNTDSPERTMRNKKTALDKLQTSLSPKYTRINLSPDFRLSRYGRHQKQKENADFVPMNVIKFVTKSPFKKAPPMSNKNSKRDDNENSVEIIIPTYDTIEIDSEDEAPSPMEAKLDLNRIEKLSDVDSAKGSSINSDSERMYKIGQIMWALFSTRHWPCMVCPEPDTNSIVKTLSRINGKSGNMTRVHVCFFNDNGRRSWILEKHLMPFEGYESYCAKIINEKEYPSKLTRFVHNIYAKKKQNPLWEKAVSQADEFRNYPISDRMMIFRDAVAYEKEMKIEMQKYVKKATGTINKPLFLDIKPKFDPDIPNSSSTPILHNLNGIKRMRSPTPESPPYEVLLPFGGVKRIKVEKVETNDEIVRNGIQRYFQSMVVGSSETGNKQYSDIDTVSASSSECDDLTDVLYDRKAFKNLMTFSKLYLFEGQTDHEIECKLEKYIKKICALKIRNDSFLSQNGNISRTSNRLRSQALRNSLRKHGIPVNHDAAKNDIQSEKIIPAKKIKKEPQPVQSIEELFLFDIEKNYLFKGLHRGNVCRVCLEPEKLIKCSGKCFGFYHQACVGGGSGDKERLKCEECASDKLPKCFVCNTDNGVLEESPVPESVIRCTIPSCGRYYHIKCLRLYPQHELSSNKSLYCPYHTCHTCVSDDPRGKSTGLSKQNLTKCVKCPSSYHTDSQCIPAGSVFITTTQIICPKHTPHDNIFINVNWCFLCSKGGSLICCDTCPTAFHLDCLKFTPPEGRYICEECETGRLPLYNEIVWAKLGNYRWWPAIIVPPPCVPHTMLRKAHGKHEFCVRFFKSHDMAWFKRRRVFLYQDGDSDHRAKANKALDVGYEKALIEAKQIYEILKVKRTTELIVHESDLKPPRYTKIKVNRYVPPLKAQPLEDDPSKCNCRHDEEDPCGMYSNCINRAIMTECDPNTCHPTCQNQRFQKRIYPAIDCRRIPGKGWGLVAMADLDVGDFIIEYVGEVIDNSELGRRLKQKQEQKDEHYYFLTIDNDTTIDAGPKGNLARFMNHSCDPNCEVQKWNINDAPRIGLFTIQDIKAGTELTFNYNLECIGDNKKICHCGAAKCSGLIGEKYKEKPKIVEPKIATKKKAKKKGKRKILVKPILQTAEIKIEREDGDDDDVAI